MGRTSFLVIVFLLIALVSSIFGFGDIAGSAAEEAQIVFWVALALFGLSMAAAIIRRIG